MISYFFRYFNVLFVRTFQLFFVDSFDILINRDKIVNVFLVIFSSWLRSPNPDNNNNALYVLPGEYVNNNNVNNNKPAVSFDLP